MNTIKLYYWREQPNFGDKLSPFLVSRLARDAVEFTDDIYDADLVAVGSHLQRINRPQDMCGMIWGTGHMMGDIPTKYDFWAMTDGIVSCVRGDMSRCFWGLPARVPVGDPGLLVPRFIPARVKARTRAVFIPHWQHEKYFSLLRTKIFERSDFEYVSPLSDTVHVAESISSASCVISSSLHAIIVADAYGVPSVWVMPRRLEESPVAGQILFKYLDYFSSIPMSRLPCFIDRNVAVTSLIRIMDDTSWIRCAPREPVWRMQRDLIATFPFELRSCHE